MPRAASAAASAETRPSISRQVQDFSPQMRPTRSPYRRAFCVSRCARFITRRDIGVTPPDGAGDVTGPVTPSPPPYPHTCTQQQHPENARDDAVLVMHARHAGLMPGKKARQLIRRQQEIDGGNNEQDDAEQGGDELHGWILLKSTRDRRALPGTPPRHTKDNPSKRNSLHPFARPAAP